MSSSELPPSEVLQHVVDVHCHPTDAPSILPESMEKLDITICAMSSKPSDQPLVYNLAKSHPRKVIPCFGALYKSFVYSLPAHIVPCYSSGYHPWFSHLVCLRGDVSKEDHYRDLFCTSSAEDLEDLEAFNTLLTSLPLPIPLDNLLVDLRRNLEEFPHAMLGEVGLDRAFRIPYDYNASPRKLSPFTVPIQHQITILQAQMDLAVELGRNISLHSVKAHQPTMELLANMETKHGVDRWNKISLDLHSCGFKPEMLKDIQVSNPIQYMYILI